MEITWKRGGVSRCPRRRLLVTHLRSPKNEELVIPNSVIINNEVVNYSSIARE